MSRMGVCVAAVALLAFSIGSARAQNQQAPGGQQEQTSANQQDVQPPEAVSPSTRFLVGLDDALSTKESKAGTRFRAHTLEPLSTPDGTVLRAGAEIRGHVDKVEPAHQAGRARMWLTFDDIHMRAGWMPLVATVSDVPGVHSVRVVYEREGEIENRTNKHEEEAEAAAAGAFVGAAAGVAAGNKKDAAIGAATGAVTAFMLSSGLGQELTLEKDTKLELVLGRALYLR
jgi:hypothetical protein